MSNKIVYAICGLKGSGKDVSASMLQYCLSVPKWMRKYWLYKIFKDIIPQKFIIIRFADPLKEMLSIMLRVDIDKFEDRNFKENYYVDFNTLTIHHKDVISKNKILSDNKFSKLAKDLSPNLTCDYYLSIRQILQFFGTEIMRYYFQDKLWILNTFMHYENKLIISDLRFKVEYEESKKIGAIIIHINRPQCEIGSHSSEREIMDLYNNKQYNYLINNNGSLKDLFNNIKNII